MVVAFHDATLATRRALPLTWAGLLPAGSRQLPGGLGTQFVGWLAPNCQRQLSILVLPDNNSGASVAERAGAVLTEGRARAIAGWSAGEDDVFDERLERSRQTRNVSFAVGGK